MLCKYALAPLCNLAAAHHQSSACERSWYVYNPAIQLAQVGTELSEWFATGMQYRCSSIPLCSWHKPAYMLLAAASVCDLLLQFRVKMVTADDDSVTDIVVEGDKEEIERMSKVGDR